MQKMSAERFPLGLRDDNDEIFAEERVARRAAVRRILKDRGLGEVMPLPQVCIKTGGTADSCASYRANS